MNKEQQPMSAITLDTPFKLDKYRRTYPIHQNRFNSMEISIASPDEIESWSSGEIKGSETVNYKTGKPEKNGLFCERIFGPVKSYECSCGKYKRAQHSAIDRCDVCGVDLTDKIVRRVRMGHIKLEAPVAHIWYHKVSGAQAIATLLDNTQIKVPTLDGKEEYRTCALKNNAIEQIIYYQAYILTDMGTLSEILSDKAIKPFTVWPIYNNDLPNVIKRLLTLVLTREQSRLSEKKNDSKTTKNINSLLMTLSKFEDENQPFDLREYLIVIEEVTGARFMTGAEAIKELLSRIDLKMNIREYKKKLSQGKKKGRIPKDLLNKLDIFESFNKKESKPEWMILSVIPVIPSDLRPMIALEGGRYSTTPLNELYRKIIIRNEKIKRLKEAKAPAALIINALRLLQEAVDTLIDNKKRNRPDLMKSSNTALKSLADSLLGKRGRFRQNLLGKRVDFSGRSVITVGPQLKLYQCGLPKELALELYKPFIMAKIMEASKVEIDGKESATINFKDAEKLIQFKNPKIWKYVHDALSERPVLLNRAPTLHRLGIQAFEPVLVDGRAIQLHPLSTTAFNADFDGDQMAVHLPLSSEAINEARTRMIGSSNILGPKDGKPIITPTQDMTLGLYFLTIERSRANFEKQNLEVPADEVLGEGKIFSTQRDALICHENKSVALHSVIGIRVSGLEKSYKFNKEDQNKILLTTIGKLIFNNIVADGVAYINDPSQNRKSKRVAHDLYDNAREFAEAVKNYSSVKKPFTKRAVSDIIGEVFDIVQENLNKGPAPLSKKEEYRRDYELNSIMSKMLDNLKDLGFRYSTTSGISIAYSDIFVPEEKEKHMKSANKHVDQIENYRKMGYFSKGEYTRRIVDLWNKTKQEIQEELVKKLRSDTNNPIYLMATSGARGNESNFTQLMGMRGIMTNPQGEAIAIPVKSSFREGLSINEFFISTHGARKGNVDTAMKTGHSGYLTRIFIDSCQNVTVDSIDCETKNTYTVRAITEKESVVSDEVTIIVPLYDRIFGRVAGEDLRKNGKLLVKKDQLITREIAERIVEEDVEEVKIWSILKGHGVSQKCYGLDLATNKLVEPNTAVGVIAAQAIGEPGTQLTMNTFHTGGVADDADITQGLPLIENIVKFQRVGTRDVEKDEDVLAKVPGIVESITDAEENDAWSDIVVKRKVHGKDERVTYRVRKQTKILVHEDDKIDAGQRLTEGNVQLYKIWKYAGIDAVYEAMLKAYHKVYRHQSISISDKYFEIVIKQMTNKIRIVSAGNTRFLPGQYVELGDYTKENTRVMAKEQAPAFGRLWILSAIQSSLLAKSFLWSISFQETTQYLAKAAIKGKVDPLQGLKENVIFGNLIPVGTGMIDDKDEFIFENNARDINKY